MSDSMEEQPQETINQPQSHEPEKRCEITVSDDKLTAYLHITEKFRSEITLEEVKNCLKTAGVKTGIVDDADITAYFSANLPPEKPLKIACGTPPTPGQNAEIKYFFDTEPLKIGTQTESGGMDFADRGKIPQVKAADLLAKKIPAIPGKAGTNIFGQIIPVEKPKDSTIVSGNGVKKSEDGHNFFASINGHPILSDDGKISVLPDLLIPGDVDLETGHINFDGPIEVSGTIQSGFRVKGKSLKTQGVDNADVDMVEDVVVSKGIIQGKIKTGSHVRAHHVDMSTIRATGDVIVGNEIIGSTIVTRGKCIAERGEILSSHITAKMGVQAADIGSDTSKACTIIVGIDGIASEEIKELNAQVKAKKTEQQRLQFLTEELEKKSQTLQEELGKIAQEEDRAMVQERSLKEKIKEVGNQAQVAQAEKIITALDAKTNQIHERIEALFAEIDHTDEEFFSRQKDVTLLGNEIDELIEEIKRRNESLGMGNGVPEVRVSGTIAANTIIRGPHASLTTTEDLHRVLIKETIIAEPDAETTWKMVVSPL
jgi:uncharacterized protein